MHFQAKETDTDVNLILHSLYSWDMFKIKNDILI